jgi:uncharacterized protein YqgV (UPF0045/DUF77 family)
MIVQAEVSIYPLDRSDLALGIYEFVRALHHAELDIDVGRMSTIVTGPSELVFTAIREAYETVGAGGRLALVVKMINLPPPLDRPMPLRP